MGSRGKAQQQQENTLAAQAAAAAAKAQTVDPLEQAERDRVKRLDDWRSGKNGPIDVRNIPDDTAIPMYQAAKQAHDTGRVGQGLAYGENSNPEFSGALSKELDMARDTNAAGMLEGHVNDILGNLDARLMGLSARTDERNQFGANLAEQSYISFLNRPQRPSFLKQFALGLAGGAGEGLASFL